METKQSSYSYAYGNEDFGRMRTQREVIITVAKQMIQLKNVKEIGNIIDIAERYVKTNMDLKVLKDYVPYMINMNADNIRAEQLPGVSDTQNGIWFFFYDKEETQRVVDELFNGIVPETDEETDQNNVVQNYVV